MKANGDAERQFFSAITQKRGPLAQLRLVVSSHRNYYNSFDMTLFLGSVDRNHGNLYLKLFALVLGFYGVTNAEVNSTE